MPKMLSKLRITLSEPIDHEGEEEEITIRNVLVNGEKAGTAYEYPDGGLEILAELDNVKLGEELRDQLKARFPGRSIQIYGIDYD